MHGGEDIAHVLSQLKRLSFRLVSVRHAPCSITILLDVSVRVRIVTHR